MKLSYLCIGGLLFTLSIFGQSTDKETVVIHDSLLNEKYITSLSLENPDRCLQLLDIAEKRNIKNMELFRINILRGMIYEVKGMYTLKENYIRKALKEDSVRLVPQRKLQVLVQLAGTLDNQNKYEEGIRTVKEGIELARQLNNKNAESKFLFSMGRMHIGMSLFDTGLYYINQAIALLENTNDVREMAQLSTAYGEKTAYLINFKQLEKAIETTHHRADVIQRMSKLPGPPPAYIDQQYGFLYTKLAFLLQKTGRETEAAKAYQHFKATNFSESERGKEEAIPYLLEAHQYQTALEINQSSMNRFKGDTINYEYLIFLDRYAKAYRGLRDFQQADNYQQRLTAITDSIYVREKTNRAQELGTIFQLNEKEIQLYDAKVFAERRRILFLAACTVGLLLAILLWNRQMNLRKTRRHYYMAAKQIDDLLAQREELRKIYAEQENNYPPTDNNEKTVDEVVNPTEDSSTAQEAEDTVQEVADYALFMHMENSIMNQKLFLQPKFGRDELIRITHLNKNQLSKFIQRYAQANLSEYLNRLRVEYSVSLMKKSPMLSIDAIAEEAGFNSRSAFYAAFSKTFNMTPAQYKKTQEYIDKKTKDTI